MLAAVQALMLQELLFPAAVGGGGPAPLPDAFYVPEKRRRAALLSTLATVLRQAAGEGRPVTLIAPTAPPSSSSAAPSAVAAAGAAAMPVASANAVLPEPFFQNNDFTVYQVPDPDVLESVLIHILPHFEAVRVRWREVA